jgi:Fungal Zn(2)-Cys(6) binuclear cluster domain/Fungal specific transcription factor domain
MMDPTLQSYIEILIRLQCNEEWPICSNCTQHSDQCSFSTRSRPSGPPSNVTTLKLGEDLMDFGHPSRSSSLAIATDTPKSALDSRLESVFSLVDLELLHNYETLTSHTLSGIPQMQTFMRVDVPRIGFAHPFMLHSLLAICALHLAHFKKDVRDFYTSQAEKHYEIALGTATTLLPNINRENCAALYMFAAFCATYTMAIGPKKGDFLLFSDNGIAEWRVLFKGVRAIIDANEWLLRQRFGADVRGVHEAAHDSAKQQHASEGPPVSHRPGDGG